ncbi:DNA-processing protein DprA [Conexibacter sp. JD483]|uniref:DNA-processing protein DprA n=1 Tax=unclassified Conexibacter TaxID=2627773 RepID=UPI0027292BBE|nr:MULTISPECIES: DNA-processing protein DprA [unclassified Conexibacter]MDO8184518.1 DNA-processing protein DprA [Conexibacter sp. CPCC 205706]MDO8197824.1 DNA-processing protein DprA [Conexibacter sp. CPCC 205762]MDR9369230.1 DNA-processing protein DprA [Conexibacter sp. JD483]
MSVNGAGTGACAVCLRRTWLIARLAGAIELAWAARRPLPALLALTDEELIAALGGERRERLRAEWEDFSAAAARQRCDDRAVTAICRCDRRYPPALRELPDPPAVLHVFGDPGRFVALVEQDCVAVVGARRGTPYGLEQARGLGRGLSAAGLTVVSGMALGIDSAAHLGALDSAGTTVAVLAGGAERAYPASKRQLHARIAAAGAVVSELPPGAAVRRWTFPARNRIIAALGRLTVVVEAGERSGSLITATLSLDLGRDVAAMPGLVTSPASAGANGLIVDGARLVRGAADVLELLYGAEAGQLTATAPTPAALPGDLSALLERVGGGCDTVAALTADGTGLDSVLAGLAQLELRRLVWRAEGGRYVCRAR